MMGKKKVLRLTSAMLDFLDMTRWLSIEELFVRDLSVLSLSERSFRLLLEDDEIVFDPSFNGRLVAPGSCFNVCERFSVGIEEEEGVIGEAADTERVPSPLSSDAVELVDVDA